MLQESLDQLHLEVGELLASRKRLVLAADADRRRIERELHDGPQQHLVALAVNLQLTRRLVDVDPAAARALLEEMGRDVQEALEGARKLAHRIYPPLLEAGGPKQLVWASDWPFVSHEDQVTYRDCVQWLVDWVPNEAARRIILAVTPASLFGFDGALPARTNKRRTEETSL